MYRGRFNLGNQFEPEPTFSGAGSGGFFSRLLNAIPKNKPVEEEPPPPKKGLFGRKRRTLTFDDGGLYDKKPIHGSTDGNY